MEISPRISEKFMKRVDVKGPDECWPWLAGKVGGGYGVAYLEKNAPIYAHRLSYLIHNGEIPQGMFVCHTCDNPSCCNPSHLWLGTNADNMRDMSAKGRTRGEANSQAILKEAEAKEILRKYAAGGVSQRQLGRAYGVSRGTISSLLTGKSWNYLREGAMELLIYIGLAAVTLVCTAAACAWIIRGNDEYEDHDIQ